MTPQVRERVVADRDAALAARASLERAAVAYAHAPVEKGQEAGDALCFAASIYDRRQADYLKTLRRAKQASDAGIEHKLGARMPKWCVSCKKARARPGEYTCAECGARQAKHGDAFRQERP